MTARDALPTLSAIQMRIFALLDKVTFATRCEAYAALMRAQREVVFAERIKMFETIEARLREKVS